LQPLYEKAPCCSHAATKALFRKSISPDGCLIALPIERAMPLRHGPEEPVKKEEADAELVSMKPLLFTLR